MPVKDPTDDNREASQSAAPCSAEERLFDLTVSVRSRGTDTSAIHRLEVHYTESGRKSGFVFDVAEPRFGGDHERFLATAAQALLTEVKSRLVAHNDFVVWFYDDAIRALVQRIAGQLAEVEPSWQRFVNELARRSRIREIGSG